MPKFLETVLILFSACLVGVGDVWLKKAAFETKGFQSVLLNRWTLGAAILYLLQVVLFAYLFSKKAELGFVGIVQITLYAVIVIAGGLLFFNETLTLTKALGMVFALIGIILLNA